jgi:hypothetical protein
MVSMFAEDAPYLKRERGRRLNYIGFAFLTLWVTTLQYVLDPRSLHHTEFRPTFGNDLG